MAATTERTDEILQVIRENRSSEANFDRLLQQLEQALVLAQNNNNATVVTALQDVKEKYAAEYRKAKEAGGTAWPEFENFVTQFERSLTTAGKEA